MADPVGVLTRMGVMQNVIEDLLANPVDIGQQAIEEIFDYEKEIQSAIQQ